MPDRRAAGLAAGDVPLSGRITDVSAWHEGWVAVIESCVTEIGLSLETRMWIAVDADHDTLRFRVDADGPERSWQRNLQLVRGVLTDTEHGEIWDFGTGQSEAMVSTNARCASWARWRRLTSASSGHRVYPEVSVPQLTRWTLDGGRRGLAISPQGSPAQAANRLPNLRETAGSPSTGRRG